MTVVDGKLWANEDSRFKLMKVQIVQIRGVVEIVEIVEITNGRLLKLLMVVNGKFLTEIVEKLLRLLTVQFKLIQIGDGTN